MTVWGVVLGAGLSRRMGRPKLALPYAGCTLLEHAVGVALASPLEGVVVVVSDPAMAPRGDRRLRVVTNPRPDRGLSSSLKLGMHEVPAEADAALVMMGDQPEVSPALVERLVRAFEAARTAAVVPTYGGQRGTPVLLGRLLFAAVEGLSGDVGMRDVLAFREDVLTVEVADLGEPFDVDTPEDYERLLRREGVWPGSA